MRTLLNDPLFAIMLMNLYEAKRITHELFLEAMDDPKLAKFIVMHEAMHDLYRVTKETK